MPNSLCTICADKLVDFHLFRQQILETQEKLLKEEPPEDPGFPDDNEFTFVNVKQEDNLDQTNSLSNDDFPDEDELNVETSTSVVVVASSKKPKKAHSTSAASKRKKSVDQDHIDKEGNDAKRKKFICDQCNRDFRYPSRFIAHYRNIHLKQYERTVCPYCPRAFTLSSNCKSTICIAYLCL